MSRGSLSKGRLHGAAGMQSYRKFRPTPSTVLIVFLLTMIWIAGGASRANVLGQVIVRATGWFAIVAAVLCFPRNMRSWNLPILILLTMVVILPILQLIPLPPYMWQDLPGRDLLIDAARLSGQVQPWRPLSMVPGATQNALESLVVPVATYIVILGMSRDERRWLPGAVLIMVCASAFVGLLQFSGTSVSNVFVNDTPGEVSGTFANRNHFALLLATGCLIAPYWCFSNVKQLRTRAPISLGMVVIFLLTILATGSRAGLALGAIAFLLGLLSAWHTMRTAMRQYPKWVFIVLVTFVVSTVSGFICVSIFANRAVSISRLITLDQAGDMRSRALPYVLGIAKAYFPYGSGIGAFDPIFRIHEPFELLKLTYFNHAHNDYIEIVLDAGLPGALILLLSLSWWIWVSVPAWLRIADQSYALPRLGSAVLLLIILASVVDYPARTPIIMAIIIIAAIWLGSRTEGKDGPPLPGD